MSDRPSPDRLVPEVGQPRGGLTLPQSGESEPLVLSRGNLFCVLNRRGDIAPAGARDLGLFHDDTRHLSLYQLHLSGGPPVVLSADTSGGAAAQVDSTLTDREFGGFLDDPQNFLHLRRKLILDGGLIEQLMLTNHLRHAVELWLELRLGADFADVFEVRGARRPGRGELLAPEAGAQQLRFAYRGLDGVLYFTLLRFEPAPARVDQAGPRWELRLLPGESTVLEVSALPCRGACVEPAPRPFDVRLRELREEHQQFVRSSTAFVCRNSSFEIALRNNLEDIDSLRLSLNGSTILGAGIPWFAAPFGRDSILTSLELLAFAPDLSVETLHTLAAYQGQRDDPYSEEEPGKIMHELRRGEMARSGEIPHSPYYGTVDATPLWLVLLGESWRWCGDRQLLQRLLPNAERALAWIERRLAEGGGFVRYQRQHKKGLENQGWKDSRDGVSFPDGTIARPPIALVEVQGYVAAALTAMATVYRELGNGARAEDLAITAAALKRRLHEAFWVDETGFYALALDGEGRKVPTITSNPGHLLFCDACPPQLASRVVDVLLSDGMFTGWGVRTLARGQAVYNPLSYHNGSVWPHDNALLALGAARVGRQDAALQLLDGLYAASLHFRRQRLPELFCGLGRAEGDYLVHYPVSCSPQAWASGALFLLLQACLGLRPDAPGNGLTISNPRLPELIGAADLYGLRVGGSRVSLHFERHGGRTHADLLGIEGDDLRVQIEIG
jgi:glycogen debranching enzyme